MSRTVPGTQVTRLVQTLREQLDLSRLPGRPGFAALAAVTTYPLDVAGGLLDAQREVAVQLKNLIVPSKPA